MIHIAVLKQNYLDMVLSGEKRVECRLTRNRIEPFGRIRVDQRVYLKESSGPFRATARVSRVELFEELEPEGVEKLRLEYGEAIGAPDTFWDSKRTARYGVLLWFKKVQEVYRGPKIPALNGRGWLMLSQENDVYPGCLTKSAKEARDARNPPTKSGSSDAR